MNIEQATKMVDRWAPLFGFGHYQREVRPLTEDAEEAWARVFFEHEEEWLLLEVCDDSALPWSTLEHLILHEMSHGLIKLAQTSDTAEETVVNRIARLILNRTAKQLYKTMNQHAAQDPQWWSKAAELGAVTSCSARPFARAHRQTS